ncbi:MAG: cytochrome C oxidase subunit IV family protein [Planctomycetota bacterium]
MSEAHESHDKLYYWIFAWLTVWTVLEIGWAEWFHPDTGAARWILISGLAGMAAIKAGLVGLYYMHLRWEGWLIWAAIIFPLVLSVVMVIGLLPDAIGYW